MTGEGSACRCVNSSAMRTQPAVACCLAQLTLCRASPAEDRLMRRLLRCAHDPALKGHSLSCTLTLSPLFPHVRTPATLLQVRSPQADNGATGVERTTPETDLVHSRRTHRHNPSLSFPPEPSGSPSASPAQTAFLLPSPVIHRLVGYVELSLGYVESRLRYVI